MGTSSKISALVSIRVEAGLKLVGDSKCGRVIKVEAKNIVGLRTELRI